MMRNGAAQFSNFLMASMPQTTMIMLRAQKIAKLSQSVHGWHAAAPTPMQTGWAVVQKEPAPRSAATTAKSAVPPIHVWMPNQPHAMNARMRAGRLAP